MGKFARSWQLLKASVDVLMHERKLLVFPLISAFCLLLVVISFALPAAFAVGLFVPGHQLQIDPQGSHLDWYVVLFVFYLVAYSVGLFFNTALVHAALTHLDGGHPTVRGSLREAATKWPQIFGYAAIAATVGVFLHALEERLGLIGRWVISLIGMAWSVVTFLVVPMLAATDVGPIDAVKRSAQLLKQTWGENLVGNLGLGVLSLLMGLAWIVIVGGLFALATVTRSPALFVLMAAVGVVGMFFLVLVQTALRGVYSAALYRFAIHGDPGGRFDRTLLEGAFRIRRRR